MGKVKKLLSSVLAVLMSLGMLGSVAFAAGTTHDITINNTTSGYEYVAYEIFAGDLSADGSTLSNIQWGSDINGDAFLSALLADGTLGSVFAGCSSPEDVALKLADETYDDAVLQAFADLANEYITGSGSTSSFTGSAYVISGVGEGYYLIENTQVPDGDSAAYTRFILYVTNDATITPKSAVPSSTKSVEDNDGDSDGVSADYAIGDDIPFTLTATLPTNFTSYDEYELIFHDSMSGMELNADSIVVKVDGSTVSSSYYSVNQSPSDCTFEVIISDVTAIAGAGNSSVITVEYTAQLTASAVKGGDGNTNTMYIEYSDDPNGDYTSHTSTTPKTAAVVLTYDLNVEKVDQQGNALNGAGFTLYVLNDSGQYEAVGSEQKGSTSFTFSGLDAGQYKLSETTTPDGYNEIADIEFKIVASHNSEGLESLTITDLAGNVISNSSISFTVSSSGAVTATVTNIPGSTLAGTGGIGNMWFYVIGGTIMLAAVVTFACVSKKNKNAAA